jgi:protein TonB
MPTETSTEQAATSTATVKPTEKSTEKPTKTPKPTGTKEATSTTVSTVTPQATATQAASGTPTADKTATLLAEAARQLANAVSRAQDVLPPQAPPVQGDDVAGVGVDTSGFYSQGNGIRTNFRFEDAEYLSRLREVLQRNFVPPRMATSEGKRTATIYFKVMRNGVITDIRVDKSSGHKRFDQIAMETVEAVSPFEALPKGTGELGITCDFVSEEE